jgi:hypothetical protein
MWTGRHNEPNRRIPPPPPPYFRCKHASKSDEKFNERNNGKRQMSRENKKQLNETKERHFPGYTLLLEVSL